MEAYSRKIFKAIENNAMLELGLDWAKKKDYYFANNKDNSVLDNSFYTTRYALLHLILSVLEVKNIKDATYWRKDKADKLVGLIKTNVDISNYIIRKLGLARYGVDKIQNSVRFMNDLIAKVFGVKIDSR